MWKIRQMPSGKLIVRGAPAIGVAAAYALVLESRRMDGENLTSDEKKAWFDGGLPLSL